MGERHKHADVIIAWANGEEIEVKDQNGKWVSLTNFPWWDADEYRIKPKTVKKEGWVNIYKRDDCLICGRLAGIYRRKETADNYADSGRVGCVRIEWEEEV